MTKDYIIINRYGNPVCFNNGDIIVYGDKQEASDDLYKTDIGLATIAYSIENGVQIATVFSTTDKNKKLGQFTYSDIENNFQEKLKKFVKTLHNWC